MPFTVVSFTIIKGIFVLRCYGRKAGTQLFSCWGLTAYRNLRNATRMAAAFKGSAEELVENGLCLLVCYEAPRHYQYVGIIMLTYQLSNLLVPGKTGTDALVLVQGHSHALAATADADTRIDFSTLHGLTQSMGKVRIVATHVTEATEILVRITVLIKILLYKLLQRKARMVAGKTNFLYFHNEIFLGLSPTHS